MDLVVYWLSYLLAFVAGSVVYHLVDQTSDNKETQLLQDCLARMRWAYSVD